MNNQLKKALALSQKTGDRLIVVDSSGQNDPFVVMPMDDYERLLGQEEAIHELTEEQLLDKINRDIATWKSRKEGVKNDEMKRVFCEDCYDDDLQDDDLVDDYTKEFDDSNQYNGEVEVEDGFSSVKEVAEEKRGKKSHWQIPSDRKEAADEIIEEDRQYLEDVPF